MKHKNEEEYLGPGAEGNEFKEAGWGPSGRYKRDMPGGKMKEAVNVTKMDDESSFSHSSESPPRKMAGMGKMGLYKRPKNKKSMNYTRQAPNYQSAGGE